MNRRNLIKYTLLSTAISGFKYQNSFSKEKASFKLKAPHLNKGDRVSIIAPATAVSDPMDIYRTQEICEKLDLKPVFTSSIAVKKSGYKTRSINERVAELHNSFKDPNIKAIFCIRGGYGSAALLPKIDWDIIKDNPKVFAGYSDITALHSGINKYTGLVTFHTPVALSSFSRLTFNSFQNTLFENRDNYIIKNPENENSIRESNPLLTINSGKSTGKLVGGNLSLITSLMGTPYELDTDNNILFIEDVGEAPYKLDRMLTQMNLAGKFDKVKGVLIGKCQGCDPSNQSSLWDRTEMEVYEHIFNGFSFPVLYGMLIGHTRDQFSLPIGVKAELNANEKYLKILESPTV